MAIRLEHGGKIYGLLTISASVDYVADEEEQSLLQEVAEDIALGLHSIEMEEECKRAEDELRKLSAVVEQSSEGMAVADLGGNVLFVNSAWAQMHGYETGEGLIGQHLDIFHNQEQLEQDVVPFNREVDENGFHTGEVGHIRRDGTPFPTLMITTLLKDEQRNIYATAAIARDITARKQAEEEKEQLQAQFLQAQKMEAVGQLTAGIAHDFNNLLTAINGFAQLMQMQMAPADPLYEHAEKILSSGQSAASLVRQLMMFSREEIAEHQVLDLNTAVTSMDDLLRRTIGEDIGLHAALTSDPWPVRADPAQVEQVIMNLAVNARHAMPDGGQLIVETANVVLDEDYAGSHLGVEPGEYVLLAVSDTGVGMSQEVQARIFEPFFTTKERGMGTGLGLATVYTIVEQSQGHIRVYSEEGQGTTFKIYLPRVRDTIQPAATALPGAEMPRGDETILMVEDNPDVRDLIQHLLQEHGYTVLEAGNGEEALEAAAGHAGPIHLLLTDVVMPGTSGKDLARQLTAARAGLKVLFMSGYTDAAIAHHGILDAGFSFLQKPFNPTDLTRKVRGVLDAC